MRQALLLSILLVIGVSMCAGQIVSNGGYTQQANPPVTPSDVVSYPAPQFPVVVSTPSMGMPAISASAVGASNATGNNQAGASAATLSPSASASQTPITVAQNAGNNAGASANRFDPGLSGSDSAWASSQDTESLAQASSKARTMQARNHPRVYTNDDIARLNQQQGAPAQNQANPSTMPASDVVNNGNQQAPAANPAAAPAQPQAPASQQQNPKPASPFQPHGD